MKKETPSIESSLQEIEDLVIGLESDDIELESAVKTYGDALTKMKALLSRLNAAKDTILVLKKDGDSLFEEPYTHD
jgi:exodeoxyribonuclease VII small subunit